MPRPCSSGSSSTTLRPRESTASLPPTTTGSWRNSNLFAAVEAAAAGAPLSDATLAAAVRDGGLRWRRSWTCDRAAATAGRLRRGPRGRCSTRPQHNSWPTLLSLSDSVFGRARLVAAGGPDASAPVGRVARCQAVRCAACRRVGRLHRRPVRRCRPHDPPNGGGRRAGAMVPPRRRAARLPVHRRPRARRRTVGRGPVRRRRHPRRSRHLLLPRRSLRGGTYFQLDDRAQHGCRSAAGEQSVRRAARSSGRQARTREVAVQRPEHRLDRGARRLRSQPAGQAAQAFGTARPRHACSRHHRRDRRRQPPGQDGLSLRPARAGIARRHHGGPVLAGRRDTGKGAAHAARRAGMAHVPGID